MNAATIRRWMEGAAESIRSERDYLTQLDAAIGDADHGTNMDRGFSALVSGLDDLDESTGPGALLISAGDSLTALGGASGALWGAAFRRAGQTLGNPDDFTCTELAAAIDEALRGIIDLGAASEGDKTMVDALAPAARALCARASEGATPAAALASTLSAGTLGMRATIPLQARKGRASYLGERSVGHQDPGATSTIMILAALERAVAGQ
jgi:dihydroxyacetone kinase-like protein